jgi:serine/threonine-protein kinase
VDRAGDVYVADSGNNRVLKLAAGSSTQTVLPFTGLASPTSVAVDPAGDVYVADPGLDSDRHGRVVKLTAGSSAQTALPSIGVRSLDDVAVDGAGDVYASVFETSGRRTINYLLRLAPGSEVWTPLPSAGAQQYVATDTADNVYVTTGGATGSVMRLAPHANAWTELPAMQGFSAPGGLAVDTHGNVYVTDNLTPGRGADGHGLVVKLPAQ